MKTDASTKGLVLAGIMALMLPLSAWSQSPSSEESPKGSRTSSDVSDKAPGSAGAKSRAGAADASELRCDNPRNEDERAACEERGMTTKPRAGATEGEKDESFGSATSGRPDLKHERSTERESRSTPKSTQ